MTTVTIITVVVVVVLTAIILTLDIVAYSSLLKSYADEVDSGVHDCIIAEEHIEKKGRIATAILSYATIVVLLSFLAFGVVSKIRGENLSFNGTACLVIKTGSMSKWYDESEHIGQNVTHFDVGDLCFFDTVSNQDELTVGDVYGYKERDVTIVHRLIEIRDEGYLFQGDANPVSDYVYYGHLVKRDAIVYRFNGIRIPGVGAFVLYAQSPFGIWSLVGILSVTVCYEIVRIKMKKIDDDRYFVLEKWDENRQRSHRL